MLELPADKQLISANVFNQKCPARYLLNTISGKWSLLVIDALKDTSMRNGELKRQIDGISQKMLTQTLRELEDLKLIIRHDRQSIPPHVDYELSELGSSLREIVCSLDRWIESNMLNIIEDNHALKVNYI